MATTRSASTRAARPPGPRALQADATRSHLIGTTIDLLGAGSYHGATVFEVAKAAGLTHGAVQHHFGSRAALMMAVTDAILRDTGPDGVAWPAPGLPLPERCAGLVQALWLRAYASQRFLAAWAVYFGSATEPDLRGHVARQRRNLAQTLHQRFLDVLPELRASTDAAAMVQLVLSALRGLGVVRLFGSPGPDEAGQLQLLGRLLLSHCQAAADAAQAAAATRAAPESPRAPPHEPAPDAALDHPAHRLQPRTP